MWTGQLQPRYSIFFLSNLALMKVELDRRQVHFGEASLSDGSYVSSPLGLEWASVSLGVQGYGHH